MSFHYLLALVSAEQSPESLMKVTLWVTTRFFLAAFDSFNIQCLREHLFAFVLDNIFLYYILL